MTRLGLMPFTTGADAARITADGLATTLAALTNIGNTSATLTSAAGFTPGTIVIISAGTATAEVALISAVAGNVVTFADPLAVAHANGAAIARAVIPAQPGEQAGVIRSPYLAGG